MDSCQALGTKMNVRQVNYYVITAISTACHFGSSHLIEGARKCLNLRASANPNFTYCYILFLHVMIQIALK